MSKTVAIFTSGEGHKSISEAIEESLKDKYQVKTFFQNLPLSRVYVALYQFFPSLNQIPFKALSNDKNIESMHKIARLKYEKKINHFFAKHQPQVLINTYGGYVSCLENLQNITKKPFINVLADPKTPFPLIVSNDAKINLTFDKKTNEFCQKYYPQAKYQTCGWFVRSRFEEEYNQIKVRKKLKLDPKTLTLLIASGSEGTTLIMKVLPTLIMSSQPVQTIVACGNNTTLFNSIKTLDAFLDKSGRTNKLIPLKFTPNIHQYMQAADLVIGKAGPNMLFESVATETPFFAITHISGQEDGNLEIIKNYNLGYVEENVLKAQKIIKRILKNPQELNKFKADVVKLKKYNQKSKQQLINLIEKIT